jgi:hypothetical protein
MPARLRRSAMVLSLVAGVVLGLAQGPSKPLLTTCGTS